MKHILVATDGSGSGDRAVTTAAKLAVALNGVLTILTVGERFASIDIRRFAEAEHATTGSAMEELCDTILERAREIAAQAGAVAVATERAVGDPTSAILQLIEDMKQDIVVVGKRGLGQLKGLLLGSVSQKLVILAPCAVMVVP